MRPVGTQILAILAASDAIGKPATAMTLTASLGIQSPQATKICRRAESYGLLDSTDDVPLRFIAREGWRQQAEPKRTAIQPMKQEAPRRMVNSVWQLGQGTA